MEVEVNVSIYIHSNNISVSVKSLNDINDLCLHKIYMHDIQLFTLTCTTLTHTYHGDFSL